MKLNRLAYKMYYTIFIIFQINNFLIQNLHEEQKFMACGFFVVDNTIIFSVFSSIVTYLVILVQFKQMEVN